MQEQVRTSLTAWKGPKQSSPFYKGCPHGSGSEGRKRPAAGRSALRFAFNRTGPFKVQQSVASTILLPMFLRAFDCSPSTKKPCGPLSVTVFHVSCRISVTKPTNAGSRPWLPLGARISDPSNESRKLNTFSSAKKQRFQGDHRLAPSLPPSEYFLTLDCAASFWEPTLVARRIFSALHWLASVLVLRVVFVLFES